MVHIITDAITEQGNDDEVTEWFLCDHRHEGIFMHNV